MDRNQLLGLAKVIAPAAVRDYAKNNGWESVEGSRRRIWLFRHPTERLLQLQIPIDRDEDTAEAVFQIAERLAMVEKRPLESVIEDLASAGSDILRFRIISDEARGGSIPLDEAESLLTGARESLSSAACSVCNPVTHHPRTDRAEVRQLLQNVRMGQTELGSFVLKVLCPLNAVTDPPLLAETQPFVRSVTQLLMRSTGQLVTGIEQGNLDSVLEAQEAPNARAEISSNLCKGLMALKGDRETGEIEMSIKWASHLQLPAPNVRSVIRLPSEYFPEIARAHQRLRPQKDEDSDKRMIGTVETLNGDVGEDGRRSGEVTLALLLPDEEEIVRARTMLNPKDYETAVKAHERGLGYVQFIGRLRRGIRVSRIENLVDFKLLSEGE